MLDAIFWVLATGAPWRDLPERFGPWQSVHRYFSTWRGGTLVVLVRDDGPDVLQRTARGRRPLTLLPENATPR